MSVWTHVAGVIRVDSCRWSENEVDRLREIVGKECRWDSPSEVWEDYEAHPDRYMPMGSEGSLQMSVWEDPDRGCVAAYTISVFGDIRDFSYPSEIVDWFKAVCEEIGEIFGIRGAVIEAYCETTAKTFVWSWSEEQDERVEYGA